MTTQWFVTKNGSLLNADEVLLLSVGPGIDGGGPVVTATCDQRGAGVAYELTASLDEIRMSLLLNKSVIGGIEFQREAYEKKTP